jgi:hypothetical protein
LLRTVAKDLKIPLDFEDAATVRGKSYPQIATELIRLSHEKSGLSLDDATAQFKDTVARRCDLHAKPILRNAYRQQLPRAQAVWIITTNYDFILESILHDAVSVLPDGVLLPRADLIPIYHLHGHRLSPSSIVIAEADYVALLGPAQYRQMRLALTLTESTTVMLGYALGDVNVRTAMEWSKTFSGNAIQRELY